MSRIETVRAAMMQAMKDHDKERKEALSLLLSALKNKAIDKRADLTEDEENAVVLREIKQCQESIEQANGREDIIAENTLRMKVYQEFAPKMMSEDEVEAEVTAVLAELGLDAPTAKQKGLIMKTLMPRVKGQGRRRAGAECACAASCVSHYTRNRNQKKGGAARMSCSLFDWVEASALRQRNHRFCRFRAHHVAPARLKRNRARAAARVREGQLVGHRPVRYVVDVAVHAAVNVHADARRVFDSHGEGDFFVQRRRRFVRADGGNRRRGFCWFAHVAHRRIRRVHKRRCRSGCRDGGFPLRYADCPRRQAVRRCRNLHHAGSAVVLHHAKALPAERSVRAAGELFHIRAVTVVRADNRSAHDRKDHAVVSVRTSVPFLSCTSQVM